VCGFGGAASATTAPGGQAMNPYIEVPLDYLKLLLMLGWVLE
jgi:hypothetical protein